MFRRSAALVCSGVMLLAACGGGGGGDAASEASTTTTAAPKRSFAGVFAGSQTTVESTVPGDEKVGEEQKGTFVLTCVDRACREIFQRASFSITSRGGGTWRLERDGEQLRGSDIREAPCDGDVEGDYRQVLTWTWTVADDGAMTGELTQEFTGCGKDSTSRTTTAMDAKPASETTPYLAGAAATKLLAALTAYDAAFKPISDTYPTCLDQVSKEATVTDGVKCFAQGFETWRAGLVAFGEAVTGDPPTGASESCAEAWKGVPPPANITTSVERARDEFRAVEAGGGDIQKAVDEHAQAALQANEPFQPAITQLAYDCISPLALRKDAKKGVSAFDVNRTLIANDDEV